MLPSDAEAEPGSGVVSGTLFVTDLAGPAMEGGDGSETDDAGPDEITGGNSSDDGVETIRAVIPSLDVNRVFTTIEVDTAGTSAAVDVLSKTARARNRTGCEALGCIPTIVASLSESGNRLSAAMTRAMATMSSIMTVLMKGHRNGVGL